MQYVLVQPDAAGNCCGCRTNPCDSCAPTLTCDSIAASKTKCGFGEYTTPPSTPPRYYLTQTVNTSVTENRYDSFGTFGTGALSVEDVYSYDADCVLSCVRSGSSSESSYGWDGTHYILCSTCSGIGSVCGHTSSTEVVVGSNLFACGVANGSYPRTDTDGTYFTSGGSPITLPGACGLTPSIGGTSSDTATTFSYTKTAVGSGFSWDVSGELTDEYTTALLKSNAEAALPAYSELYNGGIAGTCGGCGAGYMAGQSCCCSAYRNLSIDETSYVIRRFKPYFTFGSPACAGMVLTYVERFIPTLAADVTYMGTVYHAGDPDPDPAHWVDTTRTWTASGGETFHVGAEVLEPSTNGTVSIPLDSIAVDTSACPP